MSTRLIFIICMCLGGLGIATARLMPLPQVPLIAKFNPSDKQLIEPVNLNMTDLIGTVGSRSLFMSQSDLVIGTDSDRETPVDQVTWSPFDYQFIGVSVSGTKRTGWFKNRENDGLWSARQGHEINGWTLTQLNDTEARLINGSNSVSLKLFNAQEPR